MSSDNVNQVVSIHLQSFPGFFLSFLGTRFLSLYYAKICAAPEGIGFVYFNALGVPAGFVAGSSNPRGFYSRLLKRDWLWFGLASVGAIIRNPTIIGRIARGVFHPRGNPVGDDVAGVFSIGVLPEQKGTGVGKLLVQAFLYEAKMQGCKRVFLTTDHDDNEAVNAFYLKLGFSVGRHYETSEGRRMNEYWVNLFDKDADHG
jgi:GNAT superfamily N-acetyltransferase